MGKIKLLKANPRPSAALQRMLKHKGDVSEGTKYKIVARRQLLGKVVTFYSNGLRVIDGIDISEQDQHDSEILRFAHASVLINEPVGDKKMCYVDATKNKVEVWIYGTKLEKFITQAKKAVKLGQIDVECLLEEPVKKTVRLSNERNVRLSGK